MDPLSKCTKVGPHRFISEFFSVPSPFGDETFDAITMLATLEHVPDPTQIAAECARVLRPGGRMIITVPAAAVDVILRVLLALRLIEGMELEQHHGYAAKSTPQVFEKCGFRLLTWQWFQLGLNNLFVFEKPVGQMYKPVESDPLEITISDVRPHGRPAGSPQ
jgi:SAM-dependent methyltransferase